MTVKRRRSTGNLPDLTSANGGRLLKNNSAGGTFEWSEGYKEDDSGNALFPNEAIQSETSGVSGGMRRTHAEGTATLSGASTTITLTPSEGGSQIPSGARLLGVQFRVDTLITSAAATSWNAAFSGGSTTILAQAQAFTKNTKVNTVLSGSQVTSAVTDIVITPDSDTFTGGVIRAIAYYEVPVTLDDNS